ncbi:transposase [Methylocaldum szegediense]|uniref:Transposase n=1 Tax=Methylocaldum szegediense TaxID=73780 RepID=A0ABN8X0Q7_9GAMM|nr:transposase [Methylocaldum szegediense]
MNIGVDVAKTEIVVACAEGTWPVKSLPNEKNALLAWLNTLPPGSRLGLEATGSYHERLADLARAHGFTVFLLNPKDMRHDAKAMGQRGKTDRVDARLIARFVAHEHPYLIPYTPPNCRAASPDTAHPAACQVGDRSGNAPVDPAGGGRFSGRPERPSATPGSADRPHRCGTQTLDDAAARASSRLPALADHRRRRPLGRCRLAQSPRAGIVYSRRCLHRLPRSRSPSSGLGPADRASAFVQARPRRTPTIALQRRFRRQQIQTLETLV